jgi:myo-inositol-1(or 4)-monophosphatase
MGLRMGHRRRRTDRRGGRGHSGALGQALAFNTASGEAFGVLVATPGIHAAAVERLRERAMAVV